MDPTDDGLCTLAYGGPHLCLSGSCAPGDCRITADCTVAADVCSSNKCGPCDAVGTTYFVDPNNGNDVKATGSGTAGGAANSACSFKTVTAALKALNLAGAPAGITIDIVGPSTVHPGETFPLTLPGSTTVIASGGPVQVLVPAAQTGFVMAKPGSKIDGASAGLTIDGQGAALSSTPQRGVAANTGSSLTNILTNVTIQGFANQGISVAGGGGLTVQAGVKVTTSGQLPSANSFGIYAVSVGDGTALFATDIAANESPFLIEGNNGGGMSISGQSMVTMTGVPGAAVGTGSVLIDGNAGPGLQSSVFGAGSFATLKGVVFFKNGAVPGGTGYSGVRIVAGSKFSMHDSVSLANGAHGIHVLPNPNAGGNPYGGIDLGSGGNDGLNLLQDPNNKNKLVGICLDATNQSGQTLKARGNIFGANDCSMAFALLSNGTACAKAGDVGVVQAVAAMNTIDVTMCTYP